ncbi:MAG: hypothetical protein WC551_11505 [Patescibacteria group bacterium]
MNEKESPHYQELETIARERASARAERKAVMAEFKETFDGLDEREEKALEALDLLRAPAPPLVAMMEGERECPACGDIYPAVQWEVNGGRCPGCGK